MRKGEVLICNSIRPGLTLGKRYYVNNNQIAQHLSRNFTFYIENDFNSRDYYQDNDIIDEWYYKRWFYNEKELRKMKLNKICGHELKLQDYEI